ncbi:MULTISPECIES: Lrp/AsnC ligand binding domain-containing protein [Haloferax]|uniref:Lrp/AsnC family transcriptional regulator n=2 Tax=Haloferax TaxID=2251 RepID=A0A6G1Z5A6_9EURY|nr:MULTISPECIES: Lrp/AsnC ligand binding domain-containing protein [Haloferax]KAB1189010.1 Lrp/AsnC family transcriptional regulator [Haloferax sp. CBA1149]MRW81736.1 Lrp/AsnC family transcriptional regulator [Haloferax marinisediminis]
MVEAYITIQTAAGTAQDVAKQVSTLDGVRKANVVAGEVDVIAEVEADVERDLLKLISDEIHTIDGVGRTSTCIVLE